MPGVTTAYQTGVHGSRPANGAGCILYSCTTHGLVYRDDGSSWITWLTLGGGSVAASAVSFSPTAGIAATDVQAAIVEDAGDLAAHLADTVDAHDASAISFTPNGSIAATDVQAAIQEVRDESASPAIPGWVSAFVGTTDSTHFYWDGNDLASFTAQTVTGSATWLEAQNLASVLLTNQSADDVAAQLIAQSFSTGDAWTCAVKVPVVSNTSALGGNRAMGICFTDGTGTGANVVAGHIQIGNGTSAQALMVGRHGTLTAISTAPWVSEQNFYFGSGWVYIKLIYQAANTFRLQFSTDGVTWSAFGESDISKTMTPTHVGILGWNQDASTTIGTFGPLKKV